MLKGLSVFFCGLILAGISFGNSVLCEDKAKGPTLNIEYSNNGQGNEVDAFMYFIPLIMPTTVDVFTDPNITLNARVISRTSEETDDSFATTCIFEVKGQGVYEAIVDPNDMIAFSTKNDPNGSALRCLLRYIRVDGPMRGSLVVSGSIKNNQRQVDNVQARFDLDGKSPVSVRLFDIKSVDKKFLYENRTNEQIARINTLSFTRGITPPTMEAEVSSIAKANHKEGFIASLKAMVANWFLPPVPITVIGNQTMMDFGTALDSTQTAFTFPYAENLRQNVKTLMAKANNDSASNPN